MSFPTPYSHVMHGCAIAAAAASVLTIVQPASATSFSFEWDRSEQTIVSKGGDRFSDANLPLGFKDNIGKYENIETTYNDNTGNLSWSSTFSPSDPNGFLPEGAWLVLTDGPNPKGKDGSAIFYLDGNSGTLSAYSYNGQNNRTSWVGEEVLQSWDNAVSIMNDANGNRTLSFNVNVAALNSRTDLGSDWKGAQFDEKVGIWFHAIDNLNAQYDGDGNITKFDGAASYFDTGAMYTTTAVPEPAVGLLGLGVAAVGLKRRRQQNADADA